MKSFKKLIIGTLLIASAISLTSCNWIKNIMSILNEEGDSSEVSKSEPESHEKVENVIGKDGGVVTDNENITLNIPAYALTENTNISAQYIGSVELISNNLSLDFLGGAEFSPSGTTFAEPVTVNIKLNKATSNTELAVFCLNESLGIWEYVTDATISGDNASFTITHFSKYQVMNRTKEFLNEWQNIVRHAKANGLSDSEAIEAFRDFLVNDKHVMDYYIQYGGYWYEPCGLKLNGAYQINNQAGDPNQLYRSEGQGNKVGDKYGMCTVDGATSSKDKIAGLTSSSEYFDITVIVEYKIITPDIELSASKTKLKKDESATVSVRCHYTNPTNFYPEFKDLDLAGYFLKISKPAHFSVNKSSLVTDSEGAGGFVVTALEEDKAETITVSFDVIGDFGTHAEGNITFNSEGITISGHIEEQKTISYSAREVSDLDTVVNQVGSVSIELEYDFSGKVSEEEDSISGEISISNVSLRVTSEHLLFDFYYNGTLTAENDVDYFDQKNDPTTYTPEVSFVAVKNNDYEISVLGTSFDPIAIMTGNILIKQTSRLPTSNGKVTVYNSLPFTISISTGTNLLLPFDLVEGDYTYTSPSLKDQLEIVFGEGSSTETFDVIAERETVIAEQHENTVQTITVE